MRRSPANRIINVEQAELKTAIVEIRNITVNARKMTLSVFRQIPEENIIAESENEFFSLRGVPWGLVNYYWGNMYEDRLHILWQKDKELRRSLNCRHVELLKERNLAGLAIDIEHNCYFYGKNPFADIKEYNYSIGECAPSGGVLHAGYSKTFSPERIGLAEILKKYDYIINAETKKKMIAEVLIDRIKTIRKWEETVIDHENKRRHKYNSLASSLATLPQLFIAV